MRIISILVIIVFLVASSYGQSLDSNKVYHLNKWWSVSIGVVGTATDYFGVQRLLNKDRLTQSDLSNLTRSNVPGFDRIALDQNIDHQDTYILLSDITSLTSFAAPALLFFDKDIRKDWLDIVLMYYETQMLSSNLYSWGPFGPQWIDRVRPWSYYDEFTFEDRTSGRKSNSFFSGHVSTTATANFFMAKVYNDYHPNSKKWVSYALASIPTIAVGVFRVKSVNHFPSDVLVGALVGAGMGVLVPEIHRKLNVKMSAAYSSNFKGVSLMFNLN